MDFEKFNDVTLDDIVRDPNGFGAPTFEQFKANRDKWIARDDEKLQAIDKGSEVLKDVQKHVYEIEGFRCKTLEEVERVALSQGIPIKELDYRPEIVKQGGGKYEILIKFISKELRKKRNEW